MDKRKLRRTIRMLTTDRDTIVYRPDLTEKEIIKAQEDYNLAISMLEKRINSPACWLCDNIVALDDEGKISEKEASVMAKGETVVVFSPMENKHYLVKIKSPDETYKLKILIGINFCPICGQELMPNKGV